MVADVDCRLGGQNASFRGLSISGGALIRYSISVFFLLPHRICTAWRRRLTIAIAFLERNVECVGRHDGYRGMAVFRSLFRQHRTHFMCGHISGNSMWYRLKLRCHGPATVSSSGTSRPWQKGVAISEVIAARANVTVGKGLVAYSGGKWLESNEIMHLRPSQGLTAPRDP